MLLPAQYTHPNSRLRTLLPLFATLLIIIFMEVLREGYGLIAPAPSVYFLSVTIMAAVWVGFRACLIHVLAVLSYLSYLYATQLDYHAGVYLDVEGVLLTGAEAGILLANALVSVLCLYVGHQRDQNRESTHVARESRQLLQSMMDNFPTIITFKDLAGRYMDVNQGVERALGVTREELIGWADHELFPPAIAEKYQAQDRRIVGERTSMQYMETVTTSQGETYHFLETSFPLVDTKGKVYGVGRIAHDITEQEQTRLEMQRAYDIVLSAQTARSDFMAVMSHELRTPLQSILGYTELMLDGVVGGDPSPGQRENMERVLMISEHLAGLIDQLLDYAKMEAGRVVVLNPVPTDMTDLVRRSASTLHGQARAKKLDLFVAVPQEPMSACVDAGRIRQILINLVGNAIKFTPKGKVSVELRTHAPWDPWFSISVTDTGIGIPEGDIGKIFEPFWQVDDSHGAEEIRYRQLGTGLGLAITQEYIIAMGGTIGVESRHGEGSIFTVTLPKKFDHPACAVVSL
jgi:PAS domain S-box-containing protein